MRATRAPELPLLGRSGGSDCCNLLQELEWVGEFKQSDSCVLHMAQPPEEWQQNDVDGDIYNTSSSNSHLMSYHCVYVFAYVRCLN